VAIAEDFDHATSPDSFLALRCSGCGSVYMNPAPADDERERIYPPGYFAAAGSHPGSLQESIRRRRKTALLTQWCRALGPHACILDVGCGAGLDLQILQGLGGGRQWRLEGVEPVVSAVQLARKAGLTVHRGSLENQKLPSAGYDLVLLVHTLEHASNPQATLGALRRVLRPDGRAVIVGYNLASPGFRVFQGRHWGGYDMPRQRRLFSPVALRRLVARSGLELMSLSTVADGGTWLRSIRHLFQDWGAPSWLVRRLGPRSLLAPAALGAWDTVHRLRGKGALMVATVRRREPPG
jgi:SAM-dependent methyltransferase